MSAGGRGWDHPGWDAASVLIGEEYTVVHSNNLVYSMLKHYTRIY